MLTGALIGGLVGGADLSETVNLMISGAQGITTAVMRILAAGVLAGDSLNQGRLARLPKLLHINLAKQERYWP